MTVGLVDWLTNWLSEWLIENVVSDWEGLPIMTVDVGFSERGGHCPRDTAQDSGHTMQVIDPTRVVCF